MLEETDFRNVCSVTALVNSSHHLFKLLFYGKFVLGKPQAKLQKETLAL